MALSAKHQQFVNEYLTCWVATEAYQRVYPKSSYESAQASASELLGNPNISQEIQRRITEHAMTANEVLARLAEHARGDMDDYLTEDGGIDLPKARKARKTRLLKKITSRRVVRTKEDEEIEDTTTSIELYDAQAALLQIGKHLDLFSDKINIKLEKELNSALDALEKSLDSDTYAKVLAVLAGKLGGAKAEGD